MKRMHKIVTALSLLCVGTFSSLSALAIGTVDVRRCVEESKSGKKEQERFDQLRAQLEQGLANKEKEINELKPKLEDEYLDTLTPDAERQIKETFQRLQQEHQELYYNMSTALNKANYEVMQKLIALVQESSKMVAKSKKLDAVMNTEACLYATEGLDVTGDVIAQLDQLEEMKKESK